MVDVVESVLYIFILVKFKVLMEVKGDIFGFVDFVIEMFKILKEVVKVFNEDVDKVFELVKKIEDVEESVDKIEYDVKEKVFESEIIIIYVKLIWN